MVITRRVSLAKIWGKSRSWLELLEDGLLQDMPTHINAQNKQMESDFFIQTTLKGKCTFLK